MSELSIPASTRLDDTDTRTVAAVATVARIDASPMRVWGALALYEQLGTRPPLYLRLLLPDPVGTSGSIAGVGDDVTCVYEDGVIRKRVSRFVPGSLYEFEVVEQTLRLGRGIKLLGGRYALRELAGGATAVSVETRYRSRRAPRFLWSPVERLVCHAFHRFLLRSLCLRMGPT